MNQPPSPFNFQRLRPFEDMAFHPTSEKLVNILVQETRSDIPMFFRVVAGYYWCKVAGSMRAVIHSPDGLNRSDVPINAYALALAPSGAGKGVSTGMLKHEIAGRFRARFKEETFPVLAEQSIAILAQKRAARKRTDPEEERKDVLKEFESIGPLAMEFSETSSPAVKAMRHKLLIADAGSMNLEMDEIGSTLLGQQEALTTFLELFDKGVTGQKLTKQGSDNKRVEEIEGGTPTNLLMFGEPSKLLNGSAQEDQFISMLVTGYARRCFFAYYRTDNKLSGQTVDEVYAQRTNQGNSQFIEHLADHLERLADAVNHGMKIVLEPDVAKLLIEYQLYCEWRAEQLEEHEEILKTELRHRWWKSLKLAGGYAFIDGSPLLTPAHLEYAIKLAEASGDAFQSLLTRDRNYVKLAKYLARVGREVTHADMMEDLPYYKGGVSARQEMLDLAMAWGYTNNVIIKKRVESKIEFLRGESLEVTDLSQMTVAYSDQITTGYKNVTAPWDQLCQLTQLQDRHWINHHVRDGYRDNDHCIPGFNVLVLDVDGVLQLEAAKSLLEGHKALYYTTKRSTPQQNRFRIILPMKYRLVLDTKDYTEFYRAVEQAIPFKVDESCAYPSKKWLTHPGHFEYTEGELFDPLPFIPRTSKADEQNKKMLEQANIDNLERWILNKIGEGNRNNMMLRYAMILMDGGLNAMQILDKVKDLNSKLPKKLSEQEIQTSIMVTVAKKIAATGQVPATAAQAAGAYPTLPTLASLSSQLTP